MCDGRVRCETYLRTPPTPAGGAVECDTPGNCAPPCTLPCGAQTHHPACGHFFISSLETGPQRYMVSETAKRGNRTDGAIFNNASAVRVANARRAERLDAMTSGHAARGALGHRQHMPWRSSIHLRPVRRTGWVWAGGAESAGDGRRRHLSLTAWRKSCGAVPPAEARERLSPGRGWSTWVVAADRRPGAQLRPLAATPRHGLLTSLTPTEHYIF
ncbi:unnamed protein product [Leptosia nina]|uniref:Uncharacterized protein n=1 Tax=Leptosia nina TaxID=320188 RepID=A0AAV1JFY7_9NEOP